MQNSSFRGTPFDWQFSNPKQALDAGAPVLSGPIVVYSQADLDALFSYVRPVTRRQSGDASAGGRTDVDYFGPDPSGPLLMSQPPLPVPTSPPILTTSGSGSGLSVPGYYQIAYAWVHPLYLTSPNGPSSGVVIGAGQYINYVLPTFPAGVTFANLWLLVAPPTVALGKLGSASSTSGGIGNPGDGTTPPAAGPTTTYTAILNKLEKAQTLPGGVHFCEVEFTMVAWPPTYS